MSEERKERLWGPIISSEEPNEEDPIFKLKQRIKDIRESKLDSRYLEGKITIREAEDEKNKQINDLEKEITAIVYKRNERRLFK